MRLRPQSGRSVMKRKLSLALLATATAMLTLSGALPGFALDSLRIIAPAAPGGGWDQTARALEEVIQGNGSVQAVTVENVPGAGGTIGLAQLVSQEAGKPDVLMVNGLVMVGAILTNKSQVSLAQTTPIARLIGEYEVIVVPASSEIKTTADLVAQLKADPGAVPFGGGSAGGTDH